MISLSHERLNIYLKPIHHSLKNVFHPYQTFSILPTSSNMLILIYGVTGMVGHAVARAALKAGHQVRGTSRNPDKLDKDVSESLAGFVKLDDIYDIVALDKAVNGVDAIISASYYSPDAIVDGQILLLRAAERAGVKVSPLHIQIASRQ
jgi:uncharacterized protein YbjT (DUF2867 family)